MKKILILIFLMTWCAFPLAAEDDVEELKAQIQVLQNRVNELESEQNQPTQRQWDPFAQMQRMQEEMNDMFQVFDVSNMQGSLTQTALNLDLQDQGDAYLLTIDTKGLNKDKLDVDITPYAIRVSGEYSSETREDNPYGRSHSQSYGSFMNSVPMPQDADVDQIEMEQQGDQFIVRIPKKS